MRAGNPLRDIEFSHVSYVTLRFEAAQLLLRDSVGAKSFLDLGVVKLQNESHQELQIRLGLGYIGPSFVELIEPVSGPLDFYRESLHDAAPPMVWHHCCYAVPRIEQMHAIRRMHEQVGRKIVVATPECDFFYVDTRPVGGHYTEYVLMNAGLIALHESVRDAATGA